MKGYIKLLAAVVAILAILLAGSTVILNMDNNKGGYGRPYRVEAERIAAKISNGKSYSLKDYKYIKDVSKVDDEPPNDNSDYLIKEINGTLYRFDYSFHSESRNVLTVFYFCFGVICVIVIGLLVYLYFRIIRPFEKLSEYPAELAKGNLTVPLKEQKNGYFGRFLWGLDLLREKLEKQKTEELELKKQNKTMVLSLSHDIKTPIGVIELYAKALEKGLYKEESKKKEIAENINTKCEEIREYIDEIVKAESEELLVLDTKTGDFYLSELTGRIKDFYKDKLALLRTEFTINRFSDCLLSGDIDRSVEVLQNIIENALKYGNGKNISIGFSREENSLLIHISNSGCTLSDSELPHIFDSFWRGSNVGTQTGSGLGLYICRTLMHKMNGDIFAGIKNEEITVTAVFSLA